MTRVRLCALVLALIPSACADPAPPPMPTQPVVETVGPSEIPAVGFEDDPARPPPGDVPEAPPVTTGVTTFDPGVTTFDPGVTTADPSLPGITTIDPGVTTVDAIGPSPPGPPTGIEGPCFSVCDCQPGLTCLEGFCQATLQIRWCCTDPGCPSGTQCETPAGRASLCP